MSRALSRFPHKLFSFTSWRSVAVCALCWLTSPDFALAAESVQLASAETSRPEVEEILVRTWAELRSVGFLVIRCPLSGGDELCVAGSATGRLEIMERDGRLLLRASARGGMAPLTQEIDLEPRAISAEVAAVRAVELLRATLLLSLRHGNLDAEEGGTVQRFTVWEAKKEEQDEPSTPAIEPLPIAPRQSSESSEPWYWTAGIGPTFSLPGVAVPAAWGGEFFVDTAYRWFYLGAAFDAALIPATLNRREGQTKVTSISAVFRLGWSAPCGTKWTCRVGPQGGILQFDIQANESDAFSGTDARHRTFVLGGDATVARYFSKGIGVFVRGTIGVAGNAARLELTTPVILGRPTSGVSLGVTFR